MHILSQKTKYLNFNFNEKYVKQTIVNLIQNNAIK